MVNIVPMLWPPAFPMGNVWWKEGGGGGGGGGGGHWSKMPRKAEGHLIFLKETQSRQIVSELA